MASNFPAKPRYLGGTAAPPPTKTAPPPTRTAAPPAAGTLDRRQQLLNLMRQGKRRGQQRYFQT